MALTALAQALLEEQEEQEEQQEEGEEEAELEEASQWPARCREWYGGWSVFA